MHGIGLLGVESAVEKRILNVCEHMARFKS